MPRRFVILVAFSMACAVIRPSIGDDTRVRTAPDGLPAAATALLAGRVLEATNVSRYTYVRLDTGGTTIWAAGPRCPVTVGDSVSINAGPSTRNFYSPALKRTFEELYLVDILRTTDRPGDADTTSTQTLPPGQPPVGAHEHAGTTVEGFSDIQKPEGAKTVAEIWAAKTDLSGKHVVVQAKVVKFNQGIMGRNWLHLRDGSGSEGDNDLTVTTEDVVRVGDVVTAVGTLSMDRDFGAGYRYAVILENASVSAE